MLMNDAFYDGGAALFFRDFFSLGAYDLPKKLIRRKQKRPPGVKSHDEGTQRE